jgi:mRNA interferase RelE/StbE
MYRIVFTKRAYKALLRMPRDIARSIRESLDHIAADPYAKHLNVTRLQNRPGYRLRVGDWRVIYEIESDELVILVLRIGPRGGIYR